jgi:hypothetical protein
MYLGHDFTCRIACLYVCGVARKVRDPWFVFQIYYVQQDEYYPPCPEKKGRASTHFLPTPAAQQLPIMKAIPTDISHSTYRFLDSFIRSFGMN